MLPPLFNCPCGTFTIYPIHPCCTINKYIGSIAIRQSTISNIHTPLLYHIQYILYLIAQNDPHACPQVKRKCSPIGLDLLSDMTIIQDYYLQ